MSKVFKQFDSDGDGELEFREFQRAFRAIGLKKRDGTKYDVDIEMFKSFDTNGQHSAPGIFSAAARCSTIASQTHRCRWAAHLKPPNRHRFTIL